MLFSFNLVSQNQKIDSLNLALKNSKDELSRLILKNEIGEIGGIFRTSYWDSVVADAQKILLRKNNFEIKKIQAQALNNIGVIMYSHGEIQKCQNYYNKSLEILKSITDNESSETIIKKINGIKASVINNLGSALEVEGKIFEAVTCYNNGLKIQQEVNDKSGIATSLNNIGLVFNKQGDISEALNYFEKSLKIREEIGEPGAIANSINNIGLIYLAQNKWKVALNYFQRGLKLYEKTGEKLGISSSLKHIGGIYRTLNDTTLALSYYRKSLKIDQEIGNKYGEADVYNYMGLIMLNNSIKHELALEYFQKSLKIRLEINNKKGITEALRNNSNALLFLSNKQKTPALKQIYFQQAKKYADSSLFISKQLGFPVSLSESEHTLALIYKYIGNYEEALKHFKQYILYNDSTHNQNTRKASVKNQLKYEFERKEAVLRAQQEKENSISQEKNRKQQIIIWSVGSGLVLVIVFAIVIFLSLSTTRKQKLVIEEKQKEILDSIHYAKRIQNSLLPTEKYFAKHLDK